MRLFNILALTENLGIYRNIILNLKAVKNIKLAGTNGEVIDGNKLLYGQNTK